MAKTEKTPNVNADHGIVGLEYSAAKFHDADGKRIEDADGNKRRGPQHWYAKDENGKKQHISENAMLEKFGYGPEDYQGPRPTGESAEPGDEPGDPIDPTPRPPRPGDIGTVDIGAGGDAPYDYELEADGDLDDSDADDDSKVDNNRDASRRYNAKARDFVRAEKVKNEEIAELENELEFMTQAAVAFEKTGDEEKLKDARNRFLDMFDRLAELKGWTSAEKDAAFERYVATAMALMGIEPPSSEPPAPTDPAEPPAPVDPAEPPTGPPAVDTAAWTREMTALREQVARARDNLARINVKASGRIIKSRKLKAELEVANNEWQRLMTLAGAKAMEHVLLSGGDMDEAAIKQLAQDYAVTQTADLRQAQELASQRGPDGNFVKRWMHKYAQAYNKAGKIKKMLLLAPVGIVAGVGMGTILGAVGGGIMAGLVARGAVKGALTGKMQALRTKAGPDVGELNFDGISLSGPELDAATRAEMLALRAAYASREASKRSVKENMKSNRRRAGTAVGIGAIVGAASGVVANWATDQDWFRGSGVGGKVTGKDPFGGQRPDVGRHINPHVRPEVPETIPGMPTAEQFANLERLANAQGDYPWSRAMDYFHGDGAQSKAWLEEAVRRTPGAQWHGSGDNAWISVGSATDTDTVWKALATSMVDPSKGAVG